jgi:hypothetical protein
MVMDLDMFTKWAGIGSFILALLTALKVFWPEIKSFRMASWSSRLFFIFVCLGVVFSGIYYASILRREPKLGLFLPDGRELDGSRILVHMEKHGGTTPPIYTFSLGQFEMKEIGCSRKTKALVIRLFFAPAGIFSSSMRSHLSDDVEFKTALESEKLERSQLSIGACERRLFDFEEIHYSATALPREIKAALKVHYGPPTPVVAKFTLLVEEVP